MAVGVSNCCIVPASASTVGGDAGVLTTVGINDPVELECTVLMLMWLFMLIGAATATGSGETVRGALLGDTDELGLL